MYKQLKLSNEMDNRIFCFILFVIPLNSYSQEWQINYLSIEDKYVVFERKSVNNLKVLTRDTFYTNGKNKEILRNKMKLFISPDSYPQFNGEYKDLFSKVNTFIKSELNPQFEFSFISYLIISDKGGVIEVGIKSGNAFTPFEYEIAMFLKKVNKWKPALKNGKPVNAITYLPIKYICTP